MKNVPHNIKQFRVSDFFAWLIVHGAEIVHVANPYEVARYRAFAKDRGSRPALHIIYRRDNGSLTWTGDSRQHYEAFLNGRTLSSPEVAPHAESDSPSKREKLVARILERDGSDCWFCASPLADDVTLEHLVPKARRGGNALGNLVLAHRACNNAAADRPIVEKLAMRRVKVPS